MEFASRFIWKGIDLSPVSYKLLVASREKPVRPNYLPSLLVFRNSGRFASLSSFACEGQVIVCWDSLVAGIRAVATKVVPPVARYTLSQEGSERGLPWIWWQEEVGFYPQKSWEFCTMSSSSNGLGKHNTGWDLDSSVYTQLDKVPYSFWKLQPIDRG